MHFTKVQVVVPMSTPKLRGHTGLRAEVSVDTDEQTIDIKCNSMEGSYALMDLIRGGGFKIEIKEDDA